MIESKIIKICGNLVKCGILDEFKKFKTESCYILYVGNSENTEQIVSNFGEIGIKSIVGRESDVIKVFYDDAGVIDCCFKIAE